MTHLNSKNAAAPVDYASIARIASAVELRDIALRSSSASLNVLASQIPEDWSDHAFVGFDTTVGERRPDSQDFTIDSAFVAVFKAGWDSETHELPARDPGDPPEIEIHASFELTYTVSSDVGLQDQDLDNFAVANGTLHAWPYWREFADTITRRMHVPGLVVGVFKLPSRHDPGGRGETPTSSDDAPVEDSPRQDPPKPGQ
ncbi:MAG TPA: hypothetical protein VNO20_02815 [Solirubrobacterales bacterium]|nr:hypothetical protein [Solirubrobacterales bacterium]